MVESLYDEINELCGSLDVQKMFRALQYVLLFPRDYASDTQLA